MSGAIGTLIGIIFVLIILGVIYWAIFMKLLPLIPLPEPFATLIYVLCVVIMVLIVLWIIVVLLGVAGIRVPMPFRL